MYDYIIIQGSILVLVVPTFGTYLPKTAEDSCIIFWVEDNAKTMYYFNGYSTTTYRTQSYNIGQLI